MLWNFTLALDLFKCTVLDARDKLHVWIQSIFSGEYLKITFMLFDKFYVCKILILCSLFLAVQDARF